MFQTSVSRMHVASKVALASAALAVVLPLCTCKRPKTVPISYRVPPAPAEPGDLFAAVNAQVSFLQAYRAKGTIRFTNLSTGKTRSVGALARVARDRGILLQASKLGVTAFLLVANTERFWIDVPRRNRTYEADMSSTLPRFPPEKAFLNLRPAHIIDALCPPPIVPIQDGSRWLLEMGKDGYILSSYVDSRPSPSPGRPVRRITLSPEEKRISRIELFDPSGAIASDIHYGGWQPREGRMVPGTVSLERPGDGFRLDLELKKVHPLEQGGLGDLDFAVPQGRQRVRLDKDPVTQEDYVETLE